MVTMRILLVDDYKQWRLTVRSILGDNRKFQIIGEASDGMEAIEQAAALLPDLVLLDIGLPKLNGIEAAKEIRQTCPEVEIIFFTQEQDMEIKRAALATGAAAYVVKSRAACELQQTIESVMLGRNSGHPHLEQRPLEPAFLPSDADREQIFSELLP